MTKNTVSTRFIVFPAFPTEITIPQKGIFGNGNRTREKAINEEDWRENTHERE